MGWTSFNLRQPVKEWFKEQWSYENSDYEVLDSALVKRNTLYGAIRKKSTGMVFCAIFLVRWSRDYYNFTYKDMTEFAGPNQCECPKRIMNLLTALNDETDPNGWARKWRENVNEYWQKNDLLKKKDVCFKTDVPLKFRSGSSYQFFKKINRTMFAGFVDCGIFKPLCRVSVNLTHHDVEAVPCEL